MNIPGAFYFFLLILFLTGCTEKTPVIIEVDRLFTNMPPAHTGLEFENTLGIESNFNVFKYRNYFNGGGVAIGDLNGDDLPDIYLTANHGPNGLFLNLGDFKFRNITSTAGVAGTHSWATGVCMVDINGDRRLDIYVCNSGNIKGDNRANELFINQGNSTDGLPLFRERAAEFGVDDRGFSTHAAFFDYDRDGDLDLYVLNNAFRSLSTFDLSKNLRNQRDSSGGGDRLYRNDGGTFRDVSEEAGIFGSVIAFGLGVSVSDINNDGWPDIYIANDFFEKDYLYLNNHDGSFSDGLEQMIRHISHSSMGADIADLNNDGLMEIYTTDMLPEDDYRLKTTFTFDTYQFYEKQVNWGYYQQLSRNTLQLNRGFTAEKLPLFSDIALLAGVAMTDWSWCPLIFDLDNDGFKDIFVTNGIYRDVTDQDYLNYLLSEETLRDVFQAETINFAELIGKMPSTPLANYAFRNLSVHDFSNSAAQWGLDVKGFSNGAAYGDLDNDGDLDLVINNSNQPALVHRNESDTLLSNGFLRLKLEGKGMNSFAIGAKATLYAGPSGIFVQEHVPMRGFQSSVDYTLNFGLGDVRLLDSLVVDWPDGSRSRIGPVAANQTITLRQTEATLRQVVGTTPAVRPLLRDISEHFPLKFKHVENEFIDFQREPLMPHRLSTEGPRIAKGDVNADGREDLYICAAKGSVGRLFIQTASGTFSSGSETVFEKAGSSEDVDALFFDADGDGDQDLYVVSGGNEYSSRSPALRDRLYINDGRGNYTHAVNAIPKIFASGSCVTSADFDADGDPDLFVGSRSVPWKYGLTPDSQLLINDGRGNFALAEDMVAPGLRTAGMVTDALWADYDNDQDPDLILAGEWMGITIFSNEKGRLTDASAAAGLSNTGGWWNCLTVSDVDGDGYPDILAGNLGENSILKASPAEPVEMYIADWDRNGIVDQLITHYVQGKSHTIALRSDLLKHIPQLAQRFPENADFAGKDFTEIMTPEELGGAEKRRAVTMRTTVFYGSATGQFWPEVLPIEAQYSPVFSILACDVDADGDRDLVLGGNFLGVGPQYGIYDAGYGTLLRSEGTRVFSPIPLSMSGLNISGQVRDITLLKQGGREVLLIARNNAPVAVYEFE